MLSIKDGAKNPVSPAAFSKLMAALIIKYLLLIIIAAGFFYSVISIIALLGFRTGKRKSSSGPLPPISVLKPVKGLDHALKEDLEGFCTQDYPEYEVLIGFMGRNDPAVPVAEELARKYPYVKLVFGSEELGANEKVSNLYSLSRDAKYGLLAVSDSDMRVDGNYLKTIAEEYTSEPGTGLVTCLYRISDPPDLGSAFESLSIGVDFAPSVLVAKKLENGISFGLGASMLFSKSQFEEAGGFPAIADHIADDYQIGNLIWKNGRRVVLSTYIMDDIAGRSGFLSHLRHQLRWARTYRASRPKGYLGYGITHVFSFAMLLLVLFPGSLSIFIFFAALFLRFLTGLIAFSRFGLPARWLRLLALLPFKDVLSFLVWVSSFSGRKVRWRNADFIILPDGRMKKI